MPLTTAPEPVLDLRTRHRAVLAAAASWALANGRTLDLDVAAVLCEVDGERNGSAVAGVATRPRVHRILTDLPHWCLRHATPLPDGAAEALWVLLSFGLDTGRYDSASDRASALYEPLRCTGGLDRDGHPRPPHQLLDFPCQCDLEVRRPQVAGHTFWRASDGTPVELWRPAPDEPELRAWYRSFDAMAVRAREGHSPRVVPADLVTFVGRIDATRWWPHLDVYAGAQHHQQLFVASDGQTYELKADRSRKLGYRFDRLDVDLALIRTGLAWHEPVRQTDVGRYSPPPFELSYEDDESLPERWRRGPL